MPNYLLRKEKNYVDINITTTYTFNYNRLLNYLYIKSYNHSIKNIY